MPASPRTSRFHSKNADDRRKPAPNSGRPTVTSSSELPGRRNLNRAANLDCRSPTFTSVFAAHATDRPREDHSARSARSASGAIRAPRPRCHEAYHRRGSMVHHCDARLLDRPGKRPTAASHSHSPNRASNQRAHSARSLQSPASHPSRRSMRLRCGTTRTWYSTFGAYSLMLLRFQHIFGQTSFSGGDICPTAPEPRFVRPPTSTAAGGH